MKPKSGWNHDGSVRNLLFRVAAPGFFPLLAPAVGTAGIAALVAVERSALFAFVDGHVGSAKESAVGLFVAVWALVEFSHAA